MSKPKVAFICVHNSCRSQIAEELGKHRNYDWMFCYFRKKEMRHYNEKFKKVVRYGAG